MFQMSIEKRYSDISNESYENLLSFILSLKNSKSKDIRLSFLQQINQFFGYVGSSFWAVNEDYSLSDPVGMNIDKDLLNNYIDTYHKYDSTNPQHLGANVLNNTMVTECDQFVKYDPGNPYLSRLNDYAIYHSHALQIKVNGKIKASIALFRPIQAKDSLRDALDAHRLELVAPFISQEFEVRMSIDKATKRTSVLETVLNMEKSGVILFDKSLENHVIYHNPICTQYCLDFFPDRGSAKNIVQHFVDSVVVPYDSPFPEISDLTVKLKSQQGTSYRIRIVENMEDDRNLYTVFINSLHKNHVIIEDECFQNLYAILTPKEREVTMLISQGLTNQQIANRMFISLSTVKSHTQRIFRKSNVKNRASLIAMLNDI